MSFSSLINKPAPEPHLLDQIISKLQTNYSAYQDVCFFLKLNKSDNKASEIIWEKIFRDAYDLGDFYYDTLLQRACIMIKFHEGRYEILYQGHYFFERLVVWPRDVTHGHSIDRCGAMETRPMVPRELAEKGFGEISGTLSATKRNKGM